MPCPGLEHISVFCHGVEQRVSLRYYGVGCERCRDPRALAGTAASVASAHMVSSSGKTMGVRRGPGIPNRGTETACTSAACPARPTSTPFSRKRC